jgi:hypothetical protein
VAKGRTTKPVSGPQPTAAAEPGSRTDDIARIPEHRIALEKRADGTVVVRVRSEGPAESRLPDAVFAFRNGDPQYAYWLGRLAAAR